MPREEGQNKNYTMVSSQEWNNRPGETGTTIPFDAMVSVRLNSNGSYDPENNQPYGKYDIPQLDYDWYPILQKRLRKDGEPQQELEPGKEILFGSAAPKSGVGDMVDHAPPVVRQHSGIDEIDARGSFNAEDLERDLRQMQRQELGKISRNKCIG